MRNPAAGEGHHAGEDDERRDVAQAVEAPAKGADKRPGEDSGRERDACPERRPGDSTGKYTLLEPDRRRGAEREREDERAAVLEPHERREEGGEELVEAVEQNEERPSGDERPLLRLALGPGPVNELPDEDEHAGREPHLYVLVREVARVVDVDVGRDHVARGVHAGVDEAASEGTAQRGGDPVQAHKAEVRRRLGEGGRVRACARGLAEEEARVRDEYDAAEQGSAGNRRSHAADAKEVRPRRGLLKVVRDPEQEIQRLKQQDHPSDVDRPRELEGDDGGGAQKSRHGPALEVELKEKRRGGKHRDGAAEPIMLAKEHEEPAEAVEDRAQNSRDGRLAEAGEQVVKEVCAQDDLERLREHKH